MPSSRDKDKLTRATTSVAASTVGAGIGAAAGSLILPGAGTVLGAALGGAIGETVKQGITEIASRALSRRERFRTDEVIKYVYDRIRYNIAADKPLRDDGFFDLDVTCRSNADELFEGVLIKAKNENQEKKLPYLGNLFANLAFRSDISATAANYLLRVADELSYQQFCFLQLVRSVGSLDVKPVRGTTGHADQDLDTFRREERELHEKFGRYDLLLEEDNGLKQTFVDKTSHLGTTFAELLSLEQIPDNDMVAMERKVQACKQNLIDMGWHADAFDS